MKEKEIINEEKELNTQIYELGYLLVPTLSEEEVPSYFTSLKDMVSSFGGEFISEEIPRMIPLAYEMTKVISNVNNKFNNAYFGWIKFEMNTENVLILKAKLDLETNIIRFLITKTVRENTIAQKKFNLKEGLRKRTKKEESEDVAPMNEEEVDKEIEKMVAI